jgi:hypothetical protein
MQRGTTLQAPSRRCALRTGKDNRKTTRNGKDQLSLGIVPQIAQEHVTEAPRRVVNGSDREAVHFTVIEQVSLWTCGCTVRWSIQRSFQALTFQFGYFRLLGALVQSRGRCPCLGMVAFRCNISYILSTPDQHDNNGYPSNQRMLVQQEQAA